MKTVKIILYGTLAVMLALPAAHAQLRFGVKGGVNIATVKFDNVLKADNVTGFQLGPMLEYVKSSGWGMDVALLFTQKGGKLEKQAVRSNYLEVPLNVKWKLMTPLLKPYLAAGPYFGFRTGGRKIWDINGLYSDVSGQVKAGNFGAGLNFSVGAEALGFLQVGLNYGLGLTDSFKTLDTGNLPAYK
ncbi:MAG: PorT family protein, partial [Tannerella sp.]|nr:PorT family protein [Tannerella sp.]